MIRFFLNLFLWRAEFRLGRFVGRLFGNLLIWGIILWALGSCTGIIHH